ncbi:MAG: flippase-like domain-containing protein [Proteobacteria bacterium]|nr:flippase-like domain-containing protein [Pseudomonadota bacterium]
MAALIYFVGAAEIFQIFFNLQLKYILTLIAISFVLIWLSSVKWQLFIRAWGHEASVTDLMKLYTITYFYNMFAPSSLMGDAARIYHLGKKIENQKDAFITTFLERLTGLLAMVLLGCIFVLIGTTATKGLEIGILIVAFFVLLGTFICFSKRCFEIFNSIAIKSLRVCRLNELADKSEKLLAKISRAMEIARDNNPLFLKAMFWSICFHFGTVVNTYVAALAIGWENPSFSGLCVTVPLVLLVSVAPLTPSGIGLQEGAFMFFLQRVGATRPESLAVGIVLRAKTIFTAFVGWILWIQMSKEKK